MNAGNEPIAIAHYVCHVSKTDQFENRPLEARQRISYYGLVSEIGSVISAVKKELLEEDDRELTCHEIKDELGDVIWYCFALAGLDGVGDKDIFSRKLEISASYIEKSCKQPTSSRESHISDDDKEFCRRAKAFSQNREGTFKEFQDIANLKLSNDKDNCVETILVELMDLASKLMRRFLPESGTNERDHSPDANSLSILGDLAWYLTAIARVYDLSLDEIAKGNMRKTAPRRPSEHQTPLHDQDFPEDQRFPLHFEVKFQTVNKGKTTVFWNGIKMGNNVKSEYFEDDGYRFHDALHLANIAHLGWSPQWRSFMNLMRKENPTVCEIQDGHRARFVEEVVVKMIHCEGARKADILYSDRELMERPIFENKVKIPFSLFKKIQYHVIGLEVEKNSFREWQNSIREGYKVYNSLLKAGKGTVTVDLVKRRLTFCPKV